MLDSINHWILSVGGSPYAVFIGLILAAIPILAILFRWLWIGGKAALEISLKGFRNRWRRKARESVRRARILRNNVAYFEVFLRFIVYQIAVLGFGIFYLVMVLSISALVSPVVLGNSSPVRAGMVPILFALIFSIQLMLVIILKTRDFMRVAKLRTRYVRRIGRP